MREEHQEIAAYVIQQIDKNLIINRTVAEAIGRKIDSFIREEKEKGRSEKEINEEARTMYNMDYINAIEDSVFPTQACTCSVTSVNPLNLEFYQLPFVSLGYGPATNNPNITNAKQVRGETLTFLINVIFETDPREINPITGEMPGFLAQTSARWHDAIHQLMPSLNTIIVKGDSQVSTRDARLQSVSPFSEGLSDREFLQFSIEVDWVYPIDNNNPRGG